jgi:hypothetical protein
MAVVAGIRFSEWKRRFAAEYYRRVRCTIEDSGAAESAKMYWSEGMSPEDAVGCEISHYDLTDFSDSLFGW